MANRSGETCRFRDSKFNAKLAVSSFEQHFNSTAARRINFRSDVVWRHQVVSKPEVAAAQWLFTFLALLQNFPWHRIYF